MRATSFILAVAAYIQTAEGDVQHLPGSASLASRCEGEVRRLHAFFVEWFNGFVPKDRGVFDGNFTDATAEDFLFLSPSGSRVDKTSCANWVFGQHGTRFESDWADSSMAAGGNMNIVISNVDVFWHDDAACAAGGSAPACTVLFHENQQVGGPAGPVQTKANAATLRCGEGGRLMWLLEDEAWWPGFTFGQDQCPLLTSSGSTKLDVPACAGCTNCLPGTCGSCLEREGRVVISVA